MRSYFHFHRHTGQDRGSRGGRRFCPALGQSRPTALFAALVGVALAFPAQAGSDDKSGREAGKRETLSYVGDKAIAAGTRQRLRPGHARIGSRGIDVPPPPPGAIIPETPEDTELTLIVRTPDGGTRRITGQRQLSLTLGGSAAPGNAGLDLDITAKPFEHTHHVSGRWRSQFPARLLINASDSPMWPWKAQYTETPQLRDIAHAVVVLTDECGHYIRRNTSASGTFSFDWTPVGCDLAEITVYAVSDTDKVGVGRWNNGPIASAGELTNLSGDYRAYAYAHGFDIADAEGELNLGTLTVPMTDDAARGFLIMSNVQDALAYYDALPGVSRSEMPKINVEHTEGLRPANIACNEGGWGDLLRSNFYGPSIDPGFIHITWDCDDHGFDSHAHVHETSHYFQRLFLRENPSYGRFGEGMANLQGAVIRGVGTMSTAGSGLSEFLDVNSRMACWDGNDWAGVIDVFADVANCESGGGTPGFPQAAAWDDTIGSAGWFQRIVYDLVDGGGGEPLTEFTIAGQSPGGCGAACEFGQFDAVSGGEAALNDVLIHYLGGAAAQGVNSNYVDRGLSGLDLTDLLDGMICRGHATPAEIEDIVATAMGLDYDASGAPETCPHPSD